MQVAAVSRVGLGSAFPIFFRNVLWFIAVLTIFNAPIVAYVYLLMTTESSWLFEYAPYVNHAWIVVVMIGGGAISYATYRMLSGQTRSLARGVVRAVASWSSVGTAVMLFFGLYIVYLPFSKMFDTGDSWWFALVPSAAVYSVFGIACSIAVVERCGPVAALSRAVEWSRGRRLLSFGLLVALTIALYFGLKIQNQIMMELMPTGTVGYVAWWLVPLTLMNTVFALHAVFNGVFHYMAQTERGGADVQSLEAVFE